MEQINLFTKEKSNDWKWTMQNDYPKQKNGLKVFSCFACGGGSTMGYKLAGCDVIGDLELDARMNKVYVKNHHPKYNFLMDIRDFNKKEDLPEELYNLDIMDFSPPCSTFSMAGQREDAWGKKKKFREGQKEQTLDDLFFVSIETVKKLKPKVAIFENVEGLMFGNAWAYVQKIYKQLNNIGYKVKHWLLKGENMGIPQTRHRVFFIATRLDFDLNKINMGFDYEPVIFGQVKTGSGNKVSDSVRYLLENSTEKDGCLADVNKRLFNKDSRFNEMIVWDSQIAPTIHTHGFYRGNDKTKFSIEDYRNCTTFPQDYDFGKEIASYICGMSVPPVMMKRVVTRLIESGIFKNGRTNK